MFQKILQSDKAVYSKNAKVAFLINKKRLVI